MQYLKSATIALVMAALVFVAGFAGLTTCNRVSVPTKSGHLTQEEMPPAAELRGLGPLPPVPAIVPASTRRARVTGTVEIVVTGDAVIGSGVGIIDGRSGAILGWRGIASSSPPLRLEFESIPLGKHTAVVARDRASARYGYWNRVAVEVQQVGDQIRGTGTLAATVEDVQLQIEWLDGSDGIEPIVVPLLRRADDPLWSDRGTRAPRPPAINTGELALRSLGAGDYVLTLDGADLADGPVEFTVPSTSSLQLRCQRR